MSTEASSPTNAAPVVDDHRSGAHGTGVGDGGAVPSQDGPTGERTPGRSRSTRFWSLVRVPVVLWAKIYAALFVVSWLSIELLERHPAYPQGPAVFRGTNFLEGWVRWDGNWYHLIVTEGYFFTPGKQSSVAFFPAYPLTMKLVNVVLHDVFLSAVVVSLVCGLGAVVLFYRWCSARTSPETARLAVLTLVVYPYAWYLFGAAYADALFLVAAIGAFVLLGRDQPVLAGLMGIVATAARPVGAGVMVGLVAVMLEQREVITIAAVERVRAGGWRALRRPHAGDPTDPSAGDDRSRAVGLRVSPRNLRARDLGVLLAPLGLAAWCFYLWRGWGNPFLFAEAESAAGWDQAAGPTTWFKYEWFQNLGRFPERVHDTIWPLDVRDYRPWTEVLYTVGITVQFGFVLTALALVPRVLRRVGWGYAVYVLCVVAVPLLGSKDFQGTGRYMLAAFPAFFVAAEWLRDRDRFRRVWLPVSTMALIYLTSLFARAYYVA